METVEFGDINLFEIQSVSYDAGRELLEENEIHGLIVISEEGELAVIINEIGIPQTILRQFLDNYEQTVALVEAQIENNPEVLVNGWLEELGEFQNYIENLQVSDRTHNMMVVAYYSAIAMTTLFGALLSAAGMRTIYGKLSKVGARTNLSPYPKMKLVLADFAASTLIIVISQTLLILYLNYVIGIEFSSQIWAIGAIVLLGSVFATSFRIFLHTTYKKRFIYLRNHNAMVLPSRNDGTTTERHGRKSSTEHKLHKPSSSNNRQFSKTILL